MSDYEPAMGIGIPDPQDVRSVCQCAECGADLYPGERVFRVKFSDTVYCWACVDEEALDDD